MREEEMNLRGEPQRPTDNREVGSDSFWVCSQKGYLDHSSIFLFTMSFIERIKFKIIV